MALPRLDISEENKDGMALKRIYFSGLAVLFLLLIWFLRPVIVIQVQTLNTGEILYLREIKPGYTFATLIRHSVHLTPVYEYYRIDNDGRIIVTGTRFQDLGWGVPSTFEDDFMFENNFMVIKNMNKHIEFVPFRISYIASPHLLLDDCKRDIDLAAMFDNWERIDISAKKEPYIFYLFRGEKDVFPEKDKKR
ncbi:MAG: DUF1850 domain-containing protein [Synergistales bacterium]|nr:DUF1850 domain-containing protein [Synergistales bacterium]